MKSTRKEVYAAIDGERDYQDSLWTPTETRGDHSLAEWVLYLNSYVQEAMETLSRNSGTGADLDALHAIRKIAAMCVVCMEQNGYQSRHPGDIKTIHDRHKYLNEHPETD